MTLTDDFPPVLGKLPPEAAAQKLREVGDEETAAALETVQPPRPGTFAVSDWFRLWPRDRTVQNTAHTFGYIAPAPPGTELLPIAHAGNIAADATLRGKRLKISLDGLRAADYPGSGIHRVLFDFSAQNQLREQTENVHFNATYRVQEGERAAIIGYPIFIGLTVGSTGVAFRCYTVNVKNDDDERMLGMLESDVFRNGLKLATTLQPAIAPLSGMAVALTKSLATRNRNVPVQDFFMGLDFSRVPTGARLAEGSYLALQIPEALALVWDWNAWGFDPTVGQIVSRRERAKLIPYNYVTFGVSRYEEV